MLYDPHDISGKLDLSTETPADAAGKDWAAWGGTGAGDHYSGLNQITPDNVHRLKLAWQFQTGDLRRPTDSGEVTYESTPLKIGNTLYACSPHQIAIANPSSIPFVQHLVPRGPGNLAEPGPNLPAGSETGIQPMFGTPYGVHLDFFRSPLGLPCMAPPWGAIAAIDLKTNNVIWQHRVGTIQDNGPVPLPLKIGTPMLGGPLVTRGGVAFLTSTTDYYIRAFDVKTGRQLWQDRLPAGGQSNPMSYDVNGEQYIVTVDGGHQTFGTKMGDYIRAYKLQ